MQTAQEAAATAAAAARDNPGAEGVGGTAGGTSSGPASPVSVGSPAATDPKPGAAGPSAPDALPGVNGTGGSGSGSGGGGAVASTAGAAAAAVESCCLLLDLEKKPLLKVFVFLNATEVLRAAQVCRPMFRKVRGRCVALHCVALRPALLFCSCFFFLLLPFWFFTIEPPRLEHGGRCICILDGLRRSLGGRNNREEVCGERAVFATVSSGCSPERPASPVIPFIVQVDLMFGIGSQAVSAAPAPAAPTPAPAPHATAAGAAAAAALDSSTGGGRSRAGSTTSTSSVSATASGNRLGQVRGVAIGVAVGFQASTVFVLRPRDGQGAAS